MMGEKGQPVNLPDEYMWLLIVMCSPERLTCFVDFKYGIQTRTRTVICIVWLETGLASAVFVSTQSWMSVCGAYSLVLVFAGAGC